MSAIDLARIRSLPSHEIGDRPVLRIIMSLPNAPVARSMVYDDRPRIGFP